MTSEPRYAVLGAGNGGKSMAAHLGLMGFRVILYNRTPEVLTPIAKRGGIELESYEGGPHGFGRVALATPDIGEAVRGADDVMVVVPSTAHASIAQEIAPHLRDGQMVVLHPGRTGGCLEVAKVLRDAGCTADVLLTETETLIYACRSDGPTQARIFRIKDAVPLAALPARRTAEALERLAPAFPQFIDGESVLHTGLNNMGAIFHPALTLLNAGRIESTGGEFQFYIDGVTPAVARVLEALDRERVTVAAALGIRARTAREWLHLAYNATGDSLYEAIHNQPGYRGIKAPPTLRTRYIFEDIPASLVPIAALGERYGVSVQYIDSIIRLACVVDQTDYRRRGRTLEKMGIEGLSVTEINRFVCDGTCEELEMT